MDRLIGRRQRGQSTSKIPYLETKRASSEDHDRAQPSTPLRSEAYENRDRSLSFSNVPPPRRKRNFLHVFRSWWLELFTCFLAVIVLLAFVITLWKQQNKPLQTYSLGITINSLTAIYTIVLKTFCVFVVTEGIGQLKWLWYRKPRSLADFQVFDRASRGPWGSVTLLWMLKHR